MAQQRTPPDRRVFIATSFARPDGWFQWDVEAVRFDTSFNRQAGGSCSTRLGARWKAWRWTRRLRREGESA